MKKFISFLLLITFACITFTGCSDNSKKENNTSNPVEPSVISESKTGLEFDDTIQLDDRNCRLFVNGSDITENNYVRIDIQHTSAEIPLLSTMKALGADVVRQDSIVTISLNGLSGSLNTNSADFGVPVPPGGQGFREIINNDLIFDNHSIRILLKNMANAEISIDVDNMIVNIDQKTEKTEDSSLS